MDARMGSRMRKSRPKARADTLERSARLLEARIATHNNLEDPLLGQQTCSIEIGSKILNFTHLGFLQSVWGGGLDTLCMICHGVFNNASGPMIRTLSLVSLNDQVVKAKIPINNRAIITIPQALPVSFGSHNIRVYNRHFTCLKNAGIVYVPVSHAWHQAVADAHESRLENDEAIRLVFEAPIRTLLAASSKYGLDVEIWHDYISVPQWQKEAQQLLLQTISQIFNYAPHALFHWDDVSIKDLNVVETSSSDDEMLDTATKILHSRWFDRMWVVLEYVQSGEIYIVTKEYSVSPETAAWYITYIESSMAETIELHGETRFDEVLKKGFRWPLYRAWHDMERWKKRPPKLRTLGDAIYMISERQCRAYHDRFVALGGFVGNQINFETPILGSPIDIYFSLSWRALLSGDYTPLLLTPDPKELVAPQAAWLRGHTMMCNDLWDLGMSFRRASHEVIIRDGKVMPQFESVGVVEEHEFFSFSGATPQLFHHVASKIVRCSGTCPKRFEQAIARIFPSNKWKARSKQLQDFEQPKSAMLASVTSLIKRVQGNRHLSDGFRIPDADVLSRLGQLLEKYYICVYNDGSEIGIELATLISDHLGLNNIEDFQFSRIKLAASEAGWYGDNIESLLRVSCKTCAQRSLFRATMWEAPRSLAQVYRIPGLVYEETIPEGVGLVVSQGRIIGRMAYGMPACSCHKMELVELI
ncbi:hypothetical protein B0O99DRAFT_16684 [Bisporella sp. PMI_857]|nr:hypothetical protein B0O99DRAFT_16684 [Bisporella sp. PMI_857]